MAKIEVEVLSEMCEDCTEIDITDVGSLLECRHVEFCKRVSRIILTDAIDELEGLYQMADDSDRRTYLSVIKLLEKRIKE